MSGNYAKLVSENLARLQADLPPDLAARLGARQEGDRFHLRAFGRECVLGPQGIWLDNAPETGVLGVLISLYALHSQSEPLILEPLLAYKDLPGSMPYSGAFTTHAEQVLLPHVERIEKRRVSIMAAFDGQMAPDGTGGDFAFVLHPLPRIALAYIFYRADEDFPPSATCLFSRNARAFLPLDALADVGEYTSKAILQKL